MMGSGDTGRGSWLVRMTVQHPLKMTGLVLVLAIVAMIGAEHLHLNLNFHDLLPADNPDAQMYREVQERWGEGSLVIVLEGKRDRMVAMAEDLLPRLETLGPLDDPMPEAVAALEADPFIDEGVGAVYSIQARLPMKFMQRHGLVLQKERDFDRSLRIYDDPSLLGVLSGFNDDLEREYTDSEDNMRRDEVQIARSLLGLTRSLEVIQANLADEPDSPPMREAVETMILGEPWMLSLDRRMLMISLTPWQPMSGEIDPNLRLVERVQGILDDIGADHPEVTANLTGMAKIGLDEMNSVGTYTQLLSLAALVLVYLLLARSFHGWLLPLIALAPLIIGIVWTMGLLYLLIGSLNMFTVMIGIVLIGLGIDFTIHLISRWTEERARGAGFEEAAAYMLHGTGRGVITGALTSSAAFLTLMIADTRGVFEFGLAAGLGVLLTLAAVFLLLPALLVLRERRRENKGLPVPRAASAEEGWPLLGTIAAWSWRRSSIVLTLFVVVAGLSFWGATRTEFEFNFLNLEAKGLTSVELQYELPERFGTSDQVAWAVNGTIEEARDLKEQVREKPVVGDVQAISDFIPPPGRADAYRDRVEAFRRTIESYRPSYTSAQLNDRLLEEVNRLWDNLDLMSNLAFQAGLDRIVKVIDTMTGYEQATDETDSTAVLPTITGHLENGEVSGEHAATLAKRWKEASVPMLLAMANLDPVETDDLPESIRRAHIPRDFAAEYLTFIIPRTALWEKPDLDRFIEQMADVSGHISSTAKLFIVMTVETLRDGRDSALFALGVILLLLLLHFKGLKGWLATLPLIGGTFLMLGLMYLLGMKYNYINLIAVPIILGIGIDDGVHALHRYRETALHGAEKVYDSFRYVGRAILLTSLTTMIGFGSIGFYEMRGMASFGIVLFIGVGFCFVSTVIVLPAMMSLFDRKS
ncbi:MMPL family transporter [bacterium]|nr:MMPL family transporter [bacterium]